VETVVEEAEEEKLEKWEALPLEMAPDIRQPRKVETELPPKLPPEEGSDFGKGRDDERNLKAVKADDAGLRLAKDIRRIKWIRLSTASEPSR
jgi:hypothetical protein